MASLRWIARPPLVALVLVGAGVLPLVGARSASAIEVPLTIQNREARSLVSEPITSGVPFAKGVLTDPTKVRLLRGGVEIPGQFLRTATWPDGSVRWLLVDFQADLPASAAAAVTLATGTAPAAVSGITFTDSDGSLTVNTGAASYTFSKSALVVAGREATVVSGGTTWRAVPNVGGWVIEESGPMKLVVRVDGGWFDGASRLGGASIGFRCRLVFHRSRSEVRVVLTMRNNSSFGWEQGGPGFRIVLSAVRFGDLAILPDGGNYAFGPGAEKSWQLRTGGEAGTARRESRYDAAGRVAAGYQAPSPLALASPAYVSSTDAWGKMVPPLSGLPSAQQADFDRFEKLQRSKVIPADLENPPGLVGRSVWDALAVDLDSWNDYGDLRWAGNGCGDLSGNHYDWSYGMYLQLLRTGRLEFADAARLFASHEIDLDIYHTVEDGEAFNHQKNWEERTSHDSPDNCFGGGRPTHTWSQGYALHWLLTGDPRGRDGFEELIDGVRRYVYESFNDHGYCSTSEIRLQGWLTENLVNAWRVDPTGTFPTTADGAKSVPDTIRTVLRNVFDREAAAGGQGFVIPGDDNPEPNIRAMLQLCYIVEPLVKAHGEIFREVDPAYATELSGLIQRMTRYLMSWTLGGQTSTTGCPEGLSSCYLPLQIPAYVDVAAFQQTDGQIPYLLMASNAAAYCHLVTADESFRTYAQRAFSDFIRYFGVVGPDSYVDPAARTATSYNSSVYVDTETKIHGWTNRYGQYLLADLAPASVPPPVADFSFSPASPQAGQAVSFTDLSSGSPTSWQWQFGDGASSTDRNPTHAWSGAGVFTVTLVAGNAGGTGTKSATIRVTAQQPPRPLLLVPGVARSAGAERSYFMTSLWIFNPASAEVRLSLGYFPAAGSSAGGALSPVERIVPSGGTLAVDDLLGSWFGATSDTLGFVVVSAANGSVVPVVTARTYNSGSGVGTFGQFIRGVSIDGLAGAPPVRNFTGLRGDSLFRTNLGVVNLGDAQLTANVILRGENGATIGNPVPIDVPPHSVVQRSRINEAAGLPSVAAFRAEVTADGSWFAYVSKLDNRTSDPIFIPDDLAPRSAQWIDGVAAAAGSGGTFFRSSLSLTNLGHSASDVDVSYFPLGSATPAATTRLTIPAGGALFRDDALAELFGLVGGNGSLALTGGPVLAWTRTYNDTAGGTFGQFIPAFGSGELHSTGKRAWLPGLSQRADESTGGFRTNVGLVNRGGGAASLRLVATGAAGEVLGERTWPVAPGSAVRINRVLRELGISRDVDGVTIAIEPDPSGAGTYAWASVVDNSTGDAIFVPQIVRAEEGQGCRE